MIQQIIRGVGASHQTRGYIQHKDETGAGASKEAETHV